MATTKRGCNIGIARVEGQIAVHAERAHDYLLGLQRIVTALAAIPTDNDNQETINTIRNVQASDPSWDGLRAKVNSVNADRQDLTAAINTVLAAYEGVDRF
jgi:hypothetical protein